MKKVFLMLFAATAMMACSETNNDEATRENTEEVADTTAQEEVIEVETTEDVINQVEEAESEIDAIEAEVNEL